MPKQIDTQCIIDLFTGGMSTTNISKSTGYSVSTIIKHLKQSNSYEDRSVFYDGNEVVHRYVENNESIDTISKEMGMCQSSVRSHLHKRGVKIRNNSSFNDDNIQELISQYKSGLLLDDLAVIYNCSAETVSRALKAKDIDIVNHKMIGRLNDRDVVNKYNETKSLTDTALHFECTNQSIKNILIRNGFDKNFRKNKWNEKNTDEAIYLYEQGVSLDEIGKKFNATHTTIGKKLRDRGVLIRKNRSETKRSTGYKNLSGSHWARIKASARNRGLDFSISIDSTYQLFLDQNKKCKLSGVDITLSPLHRDQSDSTASLDRIDSSKGYIEGNVQWVHKNVNIMKQAMSDKEFIDWCKKIATHNSN